MSYPTTLDGFHIPNPGAGQSEYHKRIEAIHAAGDAAAAIVADRELSSRSWPLTWWATSVATGYCHKGFGGLTTDDIGWLVGCIVELLSLDPATQDLLRTYGLPSRAIRQGKRGNR